MLPQNKISGMNIAWGRGKWAELDDGTFGYVFPEDDAFQIRISPEALENFGVSEDDLYDCIAQIEAEYGAPKDHRLALGLLPNQGYSHLGLTVRSRMNERVVCVFTPTSIEDGSYDGYFEWYYDQYAGGFSSLADFMVRFDNAVDNKGGRVIDSPIMPSYGEASEKTAGILEDGQREFFLRQVWNYHKTPSRGNRIRIESELLPIWAKVCKQFEDKQFVEQYALDLKSLSDIELRSVGRQLAEMLRADVSDRGSSDRLILAKRELKRRGL